MCEADMNRRDFLGAAAGAAAGLVLGNTMSGWAQSSPLRAKGLDAIRETLNRAIADAVSQTPGRYGWIGGFGTDFVNDPDRDLTAIIMTQSTDFLFSPRLEEFWKGVYTATAP
jgi:CubicO group peptidase (beta-lactamase class C family)